MRTTAEIHLIGSLPQIHPAEPFRFRAPACHSKSSRGVNSRPRILVVANSWSPVPIQQAYFLQWLKIKELGLRRCWSMFPLARVPFWCRFFEPYPSLPTVDGQNPFAPLGIHGTPWVRWGIYRGIIRNQGFFGRANRFSSIHSMGVDQCSV